ncbi:MAG: hypothetical protein NC120_12800 [Ruminococcus sp.]|nr:hypothetical protein [Ruminococcus sp.]
MPKKYRPGFEPWTLLLLAVIMLPNLFLVRSSRAERYFKKGFRYGSSRYGGINMSGADDRYFMRRQKHRMQKNRLYAIHHRRADLLLAVLCKLDCLLYGNSKYGRYMRTDLSPVFGVFIFCR